MTSFNIIANLAKTNDTYAYGVCGNDFEGEIAIKSLQELGVNTNYISKKDIDTRAFHINITKGKNGNEIISKKSCPICLEKRWYNNTKVSIDMPKFFLDGKTLVVIDTPNSVNINICDNIKKSGGKACIDIGQTGNLKYLNSQEIKQKLYRKFNLVQLNERVADFLMDKYGFKDYEKLDEIFSSELIIITHGKKGATFIVNKKQKYYELSTISEEVDPSGAGDAFFSQVIDCYIKNECDICKIDFNDMFGRASNLSAKVVKVIGARGLIQKLYNKDTKSDSCICGKKLKNNKKRMRISTNLSYLKQRLLKCLDSNAYNKLVSQIENLEGVSIFTGTGGSSLAALYASRVLNIIDGSTTLFLYPREILYRNNKEVTNIFAFSYSGNTPDIINVLDKLEISKKTIVTKSNTVEKKYKNIEVISYSNTSNKIGKEHGFLSFEGTLAPATLFAKYAYNRLNISNQPFEEFLVSRIDYWKNYMEELFEENKQQYSVLLDKKNLIDIFIGDDVNVAGYDLESKFVESGVYRVELHEKKNFSHGRFITYEHFESDGAIYLKTARKTKYEDKLLSYLNKEKTIIIATEYEGIIGEYDLLLASQFFVGQIAKLQNIDLSKPEYSEQSMKLYKYKGNLN